MIDLMHKVSHFWVDYFGLFVIQNSLFLIVIFLFLIYFQNISARMKYLVCIIGVSKLLIPPFIPYKISSFFIEPYIPVWIPGNEILVTIEKIFSPSVQNTIIQSTGPGWIEFLFLFWIAGLLITLGMSILSVLRNVFNLRDAQKLESSIISKIIPNRGISVYISNRITMPVTLTLYPNRIFVPVAWNDWNERYREIVLTHELIHLKRYDNVIQIIQIIVSAIFFFHPLVYLLNQKMNLYREMVCDDISIRIGNSSRVEYSKCLTDIAEKAVWTPIICQSSSSFINKKSELSLRIKYQIEEETMSFISKKISVFVVVLILFSIPIFSWYVSSAEAESATVEKIKNNILEIRIHSDNDIRLDGETISISEFKMTLAEIAKKIVEPLVDLKYDENVSMNLVFKVQHTLRELNLLKVRYTDDGSKMLNLRLPGTTSEEQLKKIAKKNILSLNITSSGNVQTDNITMNISDVEKLLRDNHAENEYLIVTIKAENDVIYKDFILVLDEVRKSESKRVLIYESLE